MITTRLYLDTRYKSKSGKGNLLLFLCNGADRASIALKINLLPSEWNGSKVVHRDDAAQLNAYIGKYKSDIDTRIVTLSLDDDVESMSMAELKKILLGKSVAKNRNMLFSDIVGLYLNNDLSAGTREIYDTVLRKVTAFSGRATRIKDIDYQYVVAFNKHLSQSQGINGRAIYLRHLRAICNYALHAGIIDRNPFEHFHIKQEETRHRDISIDTLRTFMRYPVSKSQERFRDYFFLMFYLIGINAVDLLTAKPDAVVNGRLEYVRAKTHKKYSVRIEPEAQALLDKYKGERHLVEALDHCMVVKNFIHMMNKVLRSIGKEVEVPVPADDLFAAPVMRKTFVPVIPDITTYYARHTWATLASDLGVPIDVISQALGHSFGNRTTLIYVKFDQQKVDDANRKVIDYLLSSW